MTSTNPHLLKRQIKQAKSVMECVELLPEKPTADVLLAVLHVCGKHSDLQSALSLLEKHDHPESCITFAISIAGKCGDYKTALRLLNQSPTKSIPSYHTCLAACSRALAWRECLDIYHRLDPSHRSILTGNIVLSAMASCKRGNEAVAFFQDMPSHDIQSVLKVMNALIRVGDLEQAHLIMTQHAPNDPLLMERLTSAYAKANNWEMVQQLNIQSSAVSSHFQPWKVLPKIGSGRTAYWKLGTYSDDKNDLIISLQPHRNPSKNGIKIVLMQGETKIGFLLMKNTSTESSMLGAFLDPDQRQRGLSKIFLAIWMQLCLDANISPVTGVMNKPLLCLTLQHTFGYTATVPESEGVSIEISPGGKDGTILMYSPTSKSIEGAFSPADKKREGLVFCTTPPNPRGRTVIMKTSLIPPHDLVERVHLVLSSGKFEYNQEITLKEILCGS